MTRTPLKRTPMKRKPRKERTVKVDGVRVSIEEPEYLAWLRTQKCHCCSISGYSRPLGGIEAAHVGKGSAGKKCPDREAIALCGWHHRLSPYSEHRLTGNGGKDFWDYWGADRDEVVAAYRARWEQEKPRVKP